MARQIKVNGKTYNVSFARRPGHSESCKVRIGNVTYRSDIVGFGMDGAAVASLIKNLEEKFGKVEEL